MAEDTFKQKVLAILEERVNWFSGGDEMKSLHESISDEIFVKELNSLIKKIQDISVD